LRDRYSEVYLLSSYTSLVGTPTHAGSGLKLKTGVPAKVTFVRKTDETCAKEVVIKEYNIDRKLPLNEPVTVEFTPRKGEITFACGMDMLKGKLIVE
jgi:plastocyanin domain-containing protein